MLLKYISKRILLIIPTLLGIMILNFIIIQAAPGGPVEQMIAKIKGTYIEASQRITHDATDSLNSGKTTSETSQSISKYRGSQGLDPAVIKEIEKDFGFDKPVYFRFFMMMIKYIKFDFGVSFYQDKKVINLIKEKMPVSISLGLWTTLLVYLISIPLGIRKAIKDGTKFDLWTSSIIIVAYAIPGFLFAIVLIIFFASGNFLNIFPLRGLVSDNWSDLPVLMKITDYFWHITLPIIAMVIGGFAGLTMLTKNSFLEEINKQYVITARAKGLSESKVLYKHVFRNAMLIVIAGFPSAFISILFTGSVLIEVIFSLNGLGLLGFEAAINRDYPVIFGTLYIFSLLGLVMNLIGDITYVLIDPRIDFESREV